MAGAVCGAELAGDLLVLGGRRQVGEDVAGLGLADQRGGRGRQQEALLDRFGRRGRQIWDDRQRAVNLSAVLTSSGPRHFLLEVARAFCRFGGRA